MATQEFSLQQLQPFLEGNPGRGTLRVQVSTARGAFPVNRAVVEVAVMLGGARVLLYRKRTDSSGIADGFTLPAKGSCVGLRKSDTELLAQINEILATIDSDARTEMWNTAVANQPK